MFTKVPHALYTVGGTWITICISKVGVYKTAKEKLGIKRSKVTQNEFFFFTAAISLVFGWSERASQSDFLSQERSITFHFE